MALTIAFRYEQPTIMRAQVGGLDPTYAYGRYVTWEYKKVGTTKWYNVEDDDGLIVETRIEIGSYVSELVVITGLRPGTSYQLRAKIFSDNGDILTPDYITSGTYTTLEAPIIDSFNVYDTEIGSLSFDWDMSWSQCYVGTTEFEIRARHLGEEEWWSKLSGLVEDGVSYDKITVDDFGTYEFQLVLITYEVEAESSIVTATAASYVTPIIDYFDVSDIEEGSLSCKWSFDCSEIIYGVTKYEIKASKSGKDDWWTKSSGTLYEYTVSSGTFDVNEFGIYDFQLIIDTNGVQTKSDVIRAYVLPLPVNTSNFIATTTTGSLDVILNWDVDWIYNDQTEYYLTLRTKSDTGTTNVRTYKGITLMKNELIIQVPDYGEYSIYIYYTTNGLNNGNSYHSDWFTVSSDNRPTSWEWTSPMSGQLTVDENNEVHPVTAVEWDDFTSKLMELKNYLVQNNGYTFSGFPATFTPATPGAEIKALYNEVSNAMSILCTNSYGIYDNIYTISSNTKLSAAPFTSLCENYNYIIRNL